MTDLEYLPATIDELLDGHHTGEPVEISGEAAGIVWTAYRTFNAYLHQDGRTISLWGAEDRSNGAGAIQLLRAGSEEKKVISVGGIYPPGRTNLEVHYVRLDGRTEHCMRR
jgi:hypothetical protein